jgi:MFS family permease
LVYATYALGVLLTLLLAGGASDQVGRRPVLLVSLVVLMASTVLYIVADSVTWLFIARAVQGLATGAALSTASASMLDFHPRRDPNAIGTMNAVVSAAGLALGVFISSALVQAGTAPRVLPYVALLVLFAVAFAGAARLPEPILSRSQFRLTPQRPSVPHVLRAPFLLASLAVLSSWSIAGISSSLGPELSSLLFHSHNAVISGLGIVLLAGAGVLSALPGRKLNPTLEVATGSVALAAGMVLIVLAAATNSSSSFVAGSIAAGVGFGMAFPAGLRGLVTAIPPKSRGAVIAAFYIVAYGSLSVPAIAAGAVAPHLGLRTTFEIFGSIVAAVALLATAAAITIHHGKEALPAPDRASSSTKQAAST